MEVLKLPVFDAIPWGLGFRVQGLGYRSLKNFRVNPYIGVPFKICRKSTLLNCLLGLVGNKGEYNPY